MTVATAIEGNGRGGFDFPPAPPLPPVQWGRAVRALRELIADPDRT
jgi:hypothetical protein